MVTKSIQQIADELGQKTVQEMRRRQENAQKLIDFKIAVNELIRDYHVTIPGSRIGFIEAVAESADKIFKLK